MPGNWVTLSDWRRLLEVAADSRLGAACRRLLLPRAERVGRVWEEQRAGPPVQIWSVPGVQRRWNRIISGDPQIGPRRHVAEKYLAGRRGLVALSPGCGAGAKEREWARLGLFARIDACDLSPELVRAAARDAEAAGLSGVLRHFAADCRHLDLAERSYDLILAEDSLHHLAPMKKVLERFRSWLRPGGLLVVNDFAGPSRFAWKRRQVAEAERFLASLPERLRRTWRGKTKRRIDRPGRLRMLLADPSEAAQSERIRPLLGRMFEVLELREKGGALASLVLSGIAHHFCGEDTEAATALERLLETEAELMVEGAIGSDYLFAVCRRP